MHSLQITVYTWTNCTLNRRIVYNISIHMCKPYTTVVLVFIFTNSTWYRKVVYNISLFRYTQNTVQK